MRLRAAREPRLRDATFPGKGWRDKLKTRTLAGERRRRIVALNAGRVKFTRQKETSRENFIYLAGRTYITEHTETNKYFDDLASIQRMIDGASRYRSFHLRRILYRPSG